MPPDEERRRNYDRELGEHSVSLRNLEAGQTRIEQKVDLLATAIAEQRGERRARVVIAHAVSAAIGGAAGLLGIKTGLLK